MGTGAIGRFFDNADDIFNWLNDNSVAVSVINLVNRAGVTDHLLEGPATVAELAGRADLPVDKLERMLNFLVGHELLAMRNDGRLEATQRTANMHEAASYFQSVEFGKLAGVKLLPALREGKTPFELYFGQPVFEYFSANPQDAAIFADFMGFMTRRVERFLFAAHRFEAFETVADIGGSMGDLLLAILSEYPGTKGILFDLPAVVEIARPKVEASPLADRVQVVGGSFFEGVPPADLYTMKQILHDWDDEECIRILKSIRAAIKPGGRLAVIDHIISEVPAPEEALSTDIAMMMWDTGRERKLPEFEALFAASGFAIGRVTQNTNGHSVIEAVPV